MTRDELLDTVARYSKSGDWDSVLSAVDAYSKALLLQQQPPDSEVERWFAGDKVTDDKFWDDAPFRDNGDVVGIVVDALKYFMIFRHYRGEELQINLTNAIQPPANA